MSEAVGAAYLSAEDRARVLIDKKLAACGWVVQSPSEINLYAGQGVAVREFLHRKDHGRSDYALFVDRKLAGVIEAKPVGTTLTEVEHQTKKYVTGAPDQLDVPWEVLPFGYEATGEESRFTCFADAVPRSRRFFDGYFHRPDTLAALTEPIEADETTLRTRLLSMPELDTSGLWAAQVEAIRNIEKSMASNRQRG